MSKDMHNVYRRFIITGLPRTGTTWLMNMLNTMPFITCYGESNILASTNTAPCLYDETEKAIRSWIEHIARRKNSVLHTDSDILTISRMNVIDNKVVRQLQKQIADVMCNSVINWYVTDQQVVGEKTPSIQPRQIERIVELYDDSFIIVSLRNPYDWIVSYARWYYIRRLNKEVSYPFGFLSDKDMVVMYDFFTGKTHKLLPRESLLALCSAWIRYINNAIAMADKNKQMFILHYENLWENTKNCLIDILNHLDYENDVSDIDLIDKAIMSVWPVSDIDLIDKAIMSVRPVTNYDGYKPDGRIGSNTRLLDYESIELIKNRTGEEIPCLGQ